jgi:trans-2,3-dihydro-3-hydroxyanthranilate isomerase
MSDALAPSPAAQCRRYVLLDVFASTPLTGNPLAVFPEAGGLSDAQMQRAARELNLSESVFLEAGEHGTRARIFTPAAELPFAGHPVLGAGFVAARLAGEPAVTIHTARAPVAVELAGDSSATMLQPVPSEIDQIPGDELTAALGIRPPAQLPAAFENGPRHQFVLLDDAAQLAAVAPDMNALARLGEWLITVASMSHGDVRSRTFLPALGVNEDPATGSAAGPLAVLLCRRGLAPWGAWLKIRQGEGLGRPSLLEARALGSSERVEEVRVSGAVVIVGEGRLLVAAPEA